MLRATVQIVDADGNVVAEQSFEQMPDETADAFWARVREWADDNTPPGGGTSVDVS